MNLSRNIFYINFPEYIDERGSLSVIEKLPFEIKRIFYIYNNYQCLPRGGHKNKESNLILICLNGNCDIEILENDQRVIYSLNKPTQGLFIGKNVWREMNNFSPNTILLAISDKEYNAEEYSYN